MFFPFNGSLSSRFFWLAVSIVAVFVASGYMWNRYENEFKSRTEYQVSREAIATNAPPEFLQVDVKSDVFEQLSRERLSLLDQDLCQRVGEAFMEHRCVAGVYSVSKSLNGVECKIEYHKPIATLEVNSISNSVPRSFDSIGRMIPVTESGVLLKPDDVDANLVSGLIRLSVPSLDQLNKSERGGLEPVANADVQECIEIANQILSIDNGKEIERIAAVKQPVQTDFQIELANGVKVIWGVGPSQTDTNQATTSEKLIALREVVANYAGEQPGFLNLDIRSGRVRRVIPKTASISN